MTELNMGKPELRPHESRIADYAREQVAKYEITIEGLLKQRAEYASLVSDSSSENRRKAQKILDNYREVVREQGLTLGAARFFEGGISQGQTSPGIELFAYLWAKGEQIVLKWEGNDSPKLKEVKDSLNICIHSMEKAYPAGTALLRSLEWIGHGGIPDLVSKVKRSLSS